MKKSALLAALLLIAAPAFAQDNEINLKGAIDIHVHQGPDSAPRAIDADDVARQAKAAGMRAVVLKNHWEDTASLAYMVRKIVPGIEVFGGITQDMAGGGINIATRKQLALETGHISAEEALMVIKEARARGIAHIVATHGMEGPTNLSVAQ